MVKEYKFPSPSEQPEENPDSREFSQAGSEEGGRIINLQEIIAEFPQSGLNVDVVHDAFYGTHFAAEKARKGDKDYEQKRLAALQSFAPRSSNDLASELAHSGKEQWEQRPAYYNALYQEVISRGSYRIRQREKQKKNPKK